MRVMPLPGKVIVEIPSKKEKISPGGIIIPATAEDREDAVTATVLGVGPGARLRNGVSKPFGARQGDTVLVPIPSRLGRLTLRGPDGQLLVVFNQDDVLAVIEAECST